MVFEICECRGGVVVPGTIVLVRQEQQGQAGFALIGGVFDSLDSPGKRIDINIGWSPFRELAESMRDWIDSGGNIELELRKILPKSVEIKRDTRKKKHGHLHSIE